MAIVIKKRVDFDFLGEDYKDAYIVFRSIPLKDFDEILAQIDKAEKDNKAAGFMLSTIKKYFIEGNFPDIDTLKVEDLDGLDPESVIKCFTRFTGQDPDPKVLLPAPSSTAEATEPSSDTSIVKSST